MIDFWSSWAPSWPPLGASWGLRVSSWGRLGAPLGGQDAPKSGPSSAPDFGMGPYDAQDGPRTPQSPIKTVQDAQKLPQSTPKGTPVRVRLTEDSHVLGIATVPSDGDRIGVYLPLSYQIGGYLVYLPPSRVSPLDLDVESTLKLIMTGGLSANVEESALARLAPNAEIVEPAHTTPN